ncbi:hypothetical protein [Mucilaginibacter segetis]|uniref:Uncharacterized protein n=1 Tax=Mucilaginibacter segetis TaxID=2793071 RepID=A0A934PWS4_9SPHI|nr:hypothetical protein [Mucilaginibacter segetis]MBK0380585.1 hypothetical protein [Mucilaginibacter segetis]
MKQPEVFKKIGGIIQELNEQYEYLQSTVENLNDLELELFVANTHFLKDHAEILRKLNLQKSETPLALPKHTEEKPIEAEKPAETEPKYFEPLVQQAKPVESRAPFKTPEPQDKEHVKFETEPQPPAEERLTLQEQLADKRIDNTNDDNTRRGIDISGEDRQDDGYGYIREQPDTIRHELVLDEADTWDDDDDEPIQDEELLKELDDDDDVYAAPVKTPELAREPEAVKEAESDEVPEPPKVETPVTRTTPASSEPVKQGTPLTLNQKISAQLSEQKVTKPEQSAPPIANIKEAINLNDKMLFVKDLFNGYSLAYSEAIEIVNRFGSFEEADRFLKTNYVEKNNWESKKATADKFYALLKRRYA